MFYSHTFLAKKSPLGTVWIAAHLERRIKKPQIDAIDIPSYAECIMFPEVPIALRLSGHLLLGLVRIYSWKVNYLFQDCNRMLTDIRMAIASVQVNLPEDADRAPFESVTLPETFGLDALDIDESIYQINGPDNHQKEYEQITLTDEISAGQDQYVAFFINEDNRTESFSQPEMTNFGAGPMEEDVLPPFDGHLDAITTPILNSASSVDLGSNNEANVCMDGSNIPQDFQIEVMRAAVHNFEPENLEELVNSSNNLGGPHENSTPVTNRKDGLSPILEGVLPSREESFPSSSHAKAQKVAADDSDILSKVISFDQPLHDLELLPSPPPSAGKRRVNKRKIKQLYDEKIVLSNAEMKKQLKDTKRLVCKRRKLPCSVLDISRYHKKGPNEQMFNQPLLTGMCHELQETFERSFPLSSNDSGDPGDAEALPGLAGASFHYPSTSLDMEPDQQTGMDMAPELPRFDMHIGENTTGMMASPSEGGDMTPFSPTTLDSASNVRKTSDTEMLPTEHSTRAESVGNEPGTSLFSLEEEHPLDHTPNIPSMLMSEDEEDLNFLVASQASSGNEENESGNLSARTRAVARYLKDYSPSQSQDNEPGVISLNNILEGKTRKQCARMFFESLVLKSYGLINVKQEEPYGDILISRMPALSTTKL